MAMPDYMKTAVFWLTALWCIPFLFYVVLVLPNDRSILRLGLSAAPVAAGIIALAWRYKDPDLSRIITIGMFILTALFALLFVALMVIIGQAV